MGITVTEEIIAGWYADGLGSGEGENYKGFVNVRRVNSTGNTTRFTTARFGKNRRIDTLSNLEYDTFNLIDFGLLRGDIKENYPIPRPLTQAAAEMLQLRHQCYPDTHIHAVQTIDFYVIRITDRGTFKQAVLCKTASELEDPREVELLSIVSAVLERQRIWHTIVLDTQIPHQQCRNIEWARGGYIREAQLQDHPQQITDVQKRFIYSFNKDPQSRERLNSFCAAADEVHRLPPGSCLAAARQLFWDRVLFADMNSGDLEFRRIAGIKLTGIPGQLRAMEA